MTDDDLNIDTLVCFAVYTAGHAFNRVYKPLLDAIGLTYPQYLVMMALWEQDGQTVGQLGARLFLQSSTLTPLLKRLEGAGRVTRERDTEDERQVRIWLTRQGATLRRRAATIPRCLSEATGSDRAQLQSLIAELGTLRTALERSASE